MGTHRCLGNGLAETQTLLTIAAILHTAELEMHPPGYELKMTNVPTPRPSKKFKFKVKRLRKPIGIGHPPCISWTAATGASWRPGWWRCTAK